MTIAGETLEPDFAEHLRALSRRRGTVLLVFAAAFSISAGVAFLCPPVYKASALLSVEKLGSDIAASREPRQEPDDAFFETQVGLIASETQLRQVYDELGLRGAKEFAKGLRALRKAVSVVAVPKTRLCSVNAESRDPRLAAAIAGAVARAFVKTNPDNQLFMSKEVLAALQARARDPQARLVIESLPDVVNNKVIQDLKTQIYGGEAALADLRSRYTENHPAVEATRSRLEVLRLRRDHEMDTIVNSLKTELSGQLRANNVRIIDEPAVPVKPVRPLKGLTLLLGLAGGLALGVFVALLLETYDQTVKTHQDVERKLGLRFLGQIPFWPGEKGAVIYAPLVADGATPPSEAFRNLRTIVNLVDRSPSDPLLLVTSAVQAEGKTFVATNLAVALAQVGQRVLVVDGDLRKPNPHLNPASPPEVGLSDYLSGAVSQADRVAFKTEVPNLELVTCGSASKNQSELLNADHLAKFISWARARYDRVIIDGSPVFPASDVLLWARHVRRAIFVAFCGRTPAPVIQTACARLSVGGAEIVGGVINGARGAMSRYGDGLYLERY